VDEFDCSGLQDACPAALVDGCWHLKCVVRHSAYL